MHDLFLNRLFEIILNAVTLFLLVMFVYHMSDMTLKCRKDPPPQKKRVDISLLRIILLKDYLPLLLWFLAYPSCFLLLSTFVFFSVRTFHPIFFFSIYCLVRRPSFFLFLPYILFFTICLYLS
jgi:hypothetical protein